MEKKFAKKPRENKKILKGCNKKKQSKKKTNASSKHK
jgi:hypothetical protein